MKSHSGSDRKYWPEAMKKALGLESNSGFPAQLSITRNRNPPKTIPAIDFSEKSSFTSVKYLKIIKKLVSPQQNFFQHRNRKIFENSQIKFTTSKFARKWLSGPHMSFWPQQLNFTLWCATTGCGISRDTLFGPVLGGNHQLSSFYQFHVYFRTRRILFEMGGIQSISSLPHEPNFKQQDNKYDDASYRRICAEFGVDPSSDFCFTHGQNNEIGYVFTLYDDGDFAQKLWHYLMGPLSNSSNQRFSDESGSNNSNTIHFIRNDQGSYKQFEYFVPNTAHGLTKAGLSRLNQSIEAFVYCILGAQVNVCSSILGEGGRAKEAQREFLILLEDAIRTPGISKSVQLYQLAVDEAKVRLDLAVAPGTWLMPSQMVLNTGSVVGYNNKLKQARPGMKLGVNNNVNQGTKKSALHLMAGGASKVKVANSHPSNSIHKAAVAAQNTGSQKRKSFANSLQPPQPKSPDTEEHGLSDKAPPAVSDTDHEINKILIGIGAVLIAGIVFVSLSTRR